MAQEGDTAGPRCLEGVQFLVPARSWFLKLERKGVDGGRAARTSLHISRPRVASRRRRAGPGTTVPRSERAGRCPPSRGAERREGCPGVVVLCRSRRQRRAQVGASSKALAAPHPQRLEFRGRGPGSGAHVARHAPARWRGSPPQEGLTLPPATHFGLSAPHFLFPLPFAPPPHSAPNSRGSLSLGPPG